VNMEVDEIWRGGSCHGVYSFLAYSGELRVRGYLLRVACCALRVTGFVLRGTNRHTEIRTPWPRPMLLRFA
jgi:hypothetical protein